MLQGIKVVDLTSVVFGPYCTQILADLGAEVTKIEAPGIGDPFRWSAKPAVTPGMAPAWLALNRGKKSVVLDLKEPGDRKALLRAIDEADVLVVNIRGKALARLGLDYEALVETNPKLIYVHCVGYGQDGPYADLQAYDDVIQAASGTASLLGRVDGNPRPRYLPSLIADKVAGLHAAYATLAALFHRQRTGEGQLVEVPMFELFTNFMLLEHLGGLTFDPPTGPAGYARQIDPNRQPFPTADGYVSIVAYTDDAWPRIFALLGAPNFLEEQALTTHAARAQAHPRMYQAIAQFSSALSTSEIVTRCREAQIPAQAVRDLSEITSDPHLSVVDFFQWSEHPTEGRFVQTSPMVKFGAAKVQTSSVPPGLGDDTQWFKQNFCL